MNNIELILTNVTEYAEGFPVKLICGDQTNHKCVIQALNEWGCNCTQIDFYELINWIKLHEREVQELISKNNLLQ